MRVKALAALLVTAALLLSSCSTDGQAAEDAAAAPAANAEVADLAFTSETLDGGTFEGESLAGKPAVLWFWAPWCPTCRAQAGGVSTLAKEYDGEVAVVGVGGLSAPQDIRDFAGQVDGPLHLIDPEGEIWKHFGVQAQSTYLVIDADGHVVADGYMDDAVLADRVSELVG